MPETREVLDESERVELARVRVGLTLSDKWTLGDVLGVGGTATVYSAKHRNGRRVAVKILHSELAGLSRIRKRFLSEGYTANATGHAGAVAILDDGEDGGLVFLVMELLTGRTLADRVKDAERLPLEEVARIGVDVLDVLAAAHDRAILHRDVKPSNIFLTEGGDVKLLDFGAARLRESEDFVTRSGTTLGTPAFMAPEVAAGKVEAMDARSDIWSVGATLFQALTGMTVHGARTSNEALVAAATRAAPPVASVRKDIPAPLARVVDRALEFEQAQRWPNARAMQSALRLHATARPKALAVASSETTLPEVSARSPKRFPLRAVALVCVAVILGVLFSVVPRLRNEGPRARSSALVHGAPATSGGATFASLPIATSPLPSVVVPSSTVSPVPLAVPSASVAKRPPSTLRRRSTSPGEASDAVLDLRK